MENSSVAVRGEPAAPADQAVTLKHKARRYLEKESDGLSVSYFTLRKWIGWLGILLPFVVVLGAFVFSGAAMKTSVSAYYHSCMRDFFVGLLAVVGLFLVTYRGHQGYDNVASTIAGVSALGVALFPNDPGDGSVTGKLGMFQLLPAPSDVIHTVCAAVMFVTLALISLFLFTKSDRKVVQNRVYRICGVVMLVALVGIAICAMALDETQKEIFRPTLFGEAVALLAFGISWLTKGEALWKPGRAST
jgi:hypothetical protein